MSKKNVPSGLTVNSKDEHFGLVGGKTNDEPV